MYIHICISLIIYLFNLFIYCFIYLLFYLTFAHTKGAAWFEFDSKSQRWCISNP